MIYDEVGSSYISNCCPDDINPHILAVRKNILYVDLRLLPYIITAIWFRLSKNTDYWSRVSLRIIYEYAILSVIKPRIVISFVDNSVRFNLLSRVYCRARFIGIQNGYRASEVRDMAKNLCLTELYCFGEETKKNYSEYGCTIGQYHVIGSLKDSLYRTNSQVAAKQYDLCFVSQFRPARFNSTMPNLRDNTEILVKYMSRYCEQEGRSFVIAGSCKPDEYELEKDYYKELLASNNYLFVRNEEFNYSSYRLIDESEVTVTINSTIGLERFGGGQKVLFCNLTDDKYYDLPSGLDRGIWVLNEGYIDYMTFSDRISLILEIDNDSWWNDVEAKANYLMHFDKKVSAKEYISTEICKTLGRIK